MNQTDPRTDDKLEELFHQTEDLMVRAHYKAALERLNLAFIEAMTDGPQGGRALVEKIHLISGSRRRNARAVSLERRRNKT